jgi:uncharacterized membrane protein (UPF0127 family)
METLSLDMASTFAERLRGLHRYPRLNMSRGLCIFPCAAIHTAFLSYPIDVVFLDREWTVLKTVHALPPFRVAWCRNSSMAVELCAGYCTANPDFSDRIRSALSVLQVGEESTG